MLRLGLIALTSSIFGVFLAYNYKEYGETVDNSDKLLTLAGSLGSMANSTGRIFFCFIFDYWSFRTILSLMGCSLFICCIGCYFVTVGWLYLIIVVTYFLWSLLWADANSTGAHDG